MGGVALLASAAPLYGGKPANANLSDTLGAAAADIAALYRDARRADREALAARIASVTCETLTRRSGSDPEASAARGGPVAELAARLLRLRALEALQFRLGRCHDGLRAVVAAESLEASLRLRVGELAPADEATWLALAAGLAPSRAEAERLVPALYELWRRHWTEAPEAPAWDGCRTFLYFHALAGRDPRVLDDVGARPPRDAWEAMLVDLAPRFRGGEVHPFRGDDAARRLGLAVRVLDDGGAVPAWTAAGVERAARSPAGWTPEGYAAHGATLDSLAAALGDAAPRSSPILGTRRDYYRKPGQAVPDLDPATENLARRVGRGAIARLRSDLGVAMLLDRGVRLAAAAEPAVIVPGQPLAGLWTFAAGDSLHFERLLAWVDSTAVAVRPDSLAVPAGGEAAVQTAFAAIGSARAGSTVAATLGLRGTLRGWGRIEIQDRVTVAVVPPLEATLEPVDGPVVLGATKSLEVVLASRAPLPQAGELVVLATSDWSVSPARRFRFDLRRPGQTARQRLDLAVPPATSPGRYDVAVRIDLPTGSMGTLRAPLVRPLRWVVMGPFAPPARGALLAPERGVSLETRHTGLDGAQLVWQLVPAEAYDADGSLDFEAVFPDLRRPACACAFTVLESPLASEATLATTGAARVRWNGAPPADGGRVALERGRNALLLRACSDAGGWRLQAELGDDHGEPLRVAANDLERLVDGFGALRTAAPRSGGVRPPDRLVTLRFRAARDAQRVAVLGTFNAWVPVGLERQPDGTWQRDLRLSPGRYAYKLLVDGALRPDPEASESEPDGFGGRNSLLIVR